MVLSRYVLPSFTIARPAARVNQPEACGELVSGIPHILLLHGHQSLSFAHLAIPDWHNASGFQHKTFNLMLMAHAVPSYEAPMEDTDIEAVMTLKEEIDKWRRDNQSD